MEYSRKTVFLWLLGWKCIGMRVKSLFDHSDPQISVLLKSLISKTLYVLYAYFIEQDAYEIEQNEMRSLS